MINRTNLEERLIDFGAEILMLTRKIPPTMAGNHVAKQLMRSGTSVGANYQEARGAESKADFVHKLQVALKEARESYYWLTILSRTRMLPENVILDWLKESNEIRLILSKSVVTAKSHLNEPVL